VRWTVGALHSVKRRPGCQAEEVLKGSQGTCISVLHTLTAVSSRPSALTVDYPVSLVESKSDF
jgi:hypothetical protein